jgi:tellurium resistance protein TerZ
MSLNLQKGQRISLDKGNGTKLHNICVGINWGAIEHKDFFGRVTKEAVDLDASCGTFNASKQLIEKIYFGNLASIDHSIKHSGDDLTGDEDGDDGLDNEIITVDLSRLSPQVEYVAFVLNSFRGQDFGTVPYASIRIYEGTPSRVDSVFATFDIAHGPAFKGFVSMVMGVFYRKNGEWKFNAVGEPTKDHRLDETLHTVAATYL